MIWAILVLLGVPLWLCAVAILVLIMRNRALRRRPDDIPLMMRVLPDGRWRRGYGLWAHDVLAVRGSPAAWAESLLVGVRRHSAPVADAVTSGEHLPGLLGPYAPSTAPIP